MGYYSAAMRTRMVARIEQKMTALDSAYEAFDDAMNAIQDYRLDTNEGSQRARRRKLEDIQKTISILEAQIDWLSGKLNCSGLVKLNLRRKPGSTYYNNRIN